MAKKTLRLQWTDAELCEILGAICINKHQSVGDAHVFTGPLQATIYAFNSPDGSVGSLRIEMTLDTDDNGKPNI